MKNKFLKYNNKPETLREKIWHNNLEPVYGWKPHLHNFEIQNEMGSIVQKYTEGPHSNTFNVDTKSAWLRDGRPYIVLMSTQNSLSFLEEKNHVTALSQLLSLLHTCTQHVFQLQMPKVMSDIILIFFFILFCWFSIFYSSYLYEQLITICKSLILNC